VSELYDTIGVGYTGKRRPDPRIDAAIRAALGDARSVVNVGAGAGSYEPRDLEVVPVEPSAVMREQRPPELPAAIAGSAEALPLGDKSVDAAMGVLTDHHWTDRAAGLRELRRVARRRVVLFTFDPALWDLFWLNTEYLPGFEALIEPRYLERGFWAAELRELLGGDVRFVEVPVPHDCADGFYGAYWRRPRAYLDPAVRASISVFARLDRDEVAAAVERLRGDLESGRWAEGHAELLERDALELGYRVVAAELGPGDR
jgi:SAM-dependent methyltransferase